MIGTSRLVLDRITDVFFALDSHFRFTYLNESARIVFDAPDETLVGRVLWDELPESVVTQFPDRFYRAVDDGERITFELFHTTLDTWFEVRAYPAETGLSVCMIDVDERKKREAELSRDSAVVESVHDGVVTLDRNARITSINASVERLLDIDSGDVVGDHVERLLDIASIDPDDTVAIGQAISDVVIGNASLRSLEVPFVDADGIERIGEVRFVPIDHGTTSLAAIVRDVSDRRQYERVIASLHELTRWLLESDDPEEICAIAVHAGSELLELPISGVWMLDDEHGSLKPIAATAGAHDEFGGLPTIGQGEGLAWSVFEAGEPKRFDDLGEVATVYNPDTTIRSEIIAPIGTYGVLMTGSLEPDAFDETDVELVSTLAENTQAALERAERERILRDRTAQLERQTERLEAVADVLSSDLLQQLDAVADALESEEEVGDWEFPLAEDTVETTLDRAEQLVDDVREFARTATTIRRRHRVHLEQAVTTAVKSVDVELESLVLDADATLRVDPDRFGRLLETMFSDVARRASGTDVTVQIGLLGIDETDRDSRGFFVMHDAGDPPSIDSDRPFDLASGESRSETSFDSGLGLALVRAIADAHDWSLSVEDGEHGGTRIEVRDVTTLEPV